MGVYRIDGMTVEENLLKLAEDGNKPFTAALHPGIEHVLGVRVPALRALAGRIAADDWRAYLSAAGTHYMEERMLQGMVIGHVRMKDVEEYLALVSRFVPVINSWSVCDTFDFCGKRRFVEKHKARVWQYLEGWMASDGEYEVRFGVVMAMKYYVDEEYIDRMLAWMGRIRHEGYYVKMAVAWAVSVCYVKCPDRTHDFLRAGGLADDFTHNKALQKIMESYRVGADRKAAVRRMKRDATCKG